MANEEPLTAVQFGVGPIGSRVVASTHGSGFEYVGAIDIDPDKVGRDLGEVAGLDERLDIEVTDDQEAALATDPDIVFHSTVSSVASAKPQLETAMRAGANVVSTSEELAYPWWANPDIAESLDAVAREHEVTCLGAGINPGFVMDALPTVLTAPMASVEHVRVARVQDAADRRKPLQEKVGAGLDPETFEREIVQGAGHVGSTESIAMIADALGWELTDIEESIEPVIADEPVESDHIAVDPGQVAGIKQVARGFEGPRERIELDLRMYLGGSAEDRIEFDSSPPIAVTVENGYHGDISTTAMVRNVAPAVYRAQPGLTTVVDLPMVHFRNDG